VDASIEASHVALSASTGSPVIGVFQTLSFGNAGHLVPGRSKAGSATVEFVVGPGSVVEVVTGTSRTVVDVEVVVVAADADVVATPRFEWSVESSASVDREGCAPGT
jgi:hypothetical protein